MGLRVIMYFGPWKAKAKDFGYNMWIVFFKKKTLDMITAKKMSKKYLRSYLKFGTKLMHILALILLLKFLNLDNLI